MESKSFEVPKANNDNGKFPTGLKLGIEKPVLDAQAKTPVQNQIEQTIARAEAILCINPDEDTRAMVKYISNKYHGMALMIDMEDFINHEPKTKLTSICVTLDSILDIIEEKRSYKLNKIIHAITRSVCTNGYISIDFTFDKEVNVLSKDGVKRIVLNKLSSDQYAKLIWITNVHVYDTFDDNADVNGTGMTIEAYNRV